MSVSRKDFLSTAAAGLSVAALAAGTPTLAAAADTDERAPIHFHILKPTEFDGTLMLQKLTVAGQHKQVFQSVTPLIIGGWASLYIHMQNSMNAYEFSLGLGKLLTLGVLIGPSIVLGLNDAMWTKYGFGTGVLGQAMGLSATNTYYKAASSLDPSASPDDPKGMYQDWTAQAVAKRGGQFFVCHNAMTAVAMLVAMKVKSKTETVLAEWEKNVLPSFQMVPAGVAAVQQAQENGWKPFSII
jgi:hypothetical protein